MAKITSWSWVEKDDPMFTGRFKVHSVKKYAPMIKKEKKVIVKNNKKKGD